MNIIHFTHGKVNPEGGSAISRVVYALNKYEKLLGYNSKILSVVNGIRKPQKYIRDEFVEVEMFPRIYPLIRNPIFDYIKKNFNKIDIVHIHHMWFHDKNSIIKLCKKLSIPVIMTLHGNYAEYSFGLKKKIAWHLYENKYSKLVTAYRVLCREELSTIRNLDIQVPAYINANGINLEVLKQYNIPNVIDQNNSKCILLSIGRIIEGKNQFAMIKAVNMLNENDRDKVLLLLIGNGDSDYINKINEYIIENNLNNNVKMLGPIYGKKKWDYLYHSDCFIQTSWSEGMSIALAEAAVAGKPGIFTRQSNVSYFYNSNFFIMCEPYEDDICNAINEFINSKDKWSEMSKNAKQFAKQNLSHEIITQNMISLYRKVIDNV